jgi:hypothetical protein
MSLLATNHQATVHPESPATVWVAEITYDDGRSERAEADSRDEMLVTLLSWKGKTTAGELPEKRVWLQPGTTAVMEFMTLVPQYRPTSKNYFKLNRWLQAENKAVTVKNLVEAFDYLFDRHLLDEHGQELDADKQRVYEEKIREEEL